MKASDIPSKKMTTGGWICQLKLKAVRTGTDYFSTLKNEIWINLHQAVSYKNFIEMAMIEFF